MTSLASTEAPVARGRSRLIRVALILSLVLNLGFVGGALWTRLHIANPLVTPGERFQEMATELKLDPQQRVAFERYFRMLRARSQLMREEVQPLVADAWAELAKPDADTTRIAQLFDGAAEKRHAYQHEVTSATAVFLAKLSAQQRASFVAIARQRQTPWAQRINRSVSP